MRRSVCVHMTDLLHCTAEIRVSQAVLVVTNRSDDAGDAGDVGKTPWRRARQSTLVFLPGESQGQRSMMGYSPWSCTGLDVTEATEDTLMHTQQKRMQQCKALTFQV